MRRSTNRHVMGEWATRNATENATLTGTVNGDTFGITEVSGSFLPPYIRKSSTAVCIVILAAGLLGNLLVPYVVYRTKELRSSTNLFLINLCVADLLVLVVCMPTVLLELHSRPEVWELGAVMCKVVPFLELSVAHGSVLTILAISLERYYAICLPLKAGTTCTKPRAATIITCIWIAALLVTSPVLAIAQFQYVPYIDGTDVPACLTIASKPWQKAYFVFVTGSFFWLPLIILVALYAIITRHLMTNGKLLHSAGESSRMKSRRQVVVMLTCVVVCFFVCLMPFRVFALWLVLTPINHIRALGVDAYYSVLYFCRVMLYINSAVNPVLYNLISSKFRDALVRVLCCNSGRRLVRQSTSSTTYTSLTQNSLRGFFRFVHGATLSTSATASSVATQGINSSKNHEESCL